MVSHVFFKDPAQHKKKKHMKIHEVRLHWEEMYCHGDTLLHNGNTLVSGVLWAGLGFALFIYMLIVILDDYLES